MPRARISEGRGEGEERTGVRLCSLVLFCGHAILSNGYPASGVYTPPSPKGEGLTAPSVSRRGGKRKRERKTVPFVSASKSEIAAVSGLSSLIAEFIEIAAAVFAYGKAISKEKGNGKPFPLFLHQNRKPC